MDEDSNNLFKSGEAVDGAASEHHPSPVAPERPAESSTTAASKEEPRSLAATSRAAVSGGYTSAEWIRARQPCRQDTFNKLYSYAQLPHLVLSERIRKKREDCSAMGFLRHLIPMLVWLPDYSWRRDLLSDIISGLTVGVMHLPQGLAYAMLAGVPPITGLYMAFFPVIIYAFMGTSHHVSMGTFSVVCIMTSNAVLEFSSAPIDLFTEDSINSTNSSMLIDDYIEEAVEMLSPVQVATAVCFLVGIVQLLMGIFKLGMLSVLLSDTLVSGFTTAAALHVLASQLKNLTGIKINNHSGVFKVIYVLNDLFTNVHTANLVSLGISSVTIILLVIFTEKIKPWIENRCRYPVPIELILITIGTFLSSIFEMADTYKISTVGEIPVGLPAPALPPFSLIPRILADGIIIAIVAFSINLSMASILAKKGGYSIDANQELIASGTGNVFASFFACVPFAASLSRSLIQQNVGGKTQIASLVSCLLLLLVLLVIGPFFEPLPNCVLASIVLVALKKMFEQFSHLPAAWRKSRLDGGVWIVTFLSSVLLDIDYGLAIGIAMSVLSVLHFSQKLNVLCLGNVPETNLYLDKNRYLAAREIPGICIIQIAGGLHYANRDYVIQKCYKLIGMSSTSAGGDVDPCDDCENENHENDELHCVVLDMQGVCFLDPSAADAISAMHKDLRKSMGVVVFLANCSTSVVESLDRYKFFEGEYSYDHVFPSVHDAVFHAQLRVTEV